MAAPLAQLIRVVLLWMLLMVAETLQGAVRNWLWGPDVEFVIRQVSVMSGAVAIFALTWLGFGWLRIQTDAGALAAGLTWIALTVAYEAALSRVLGLPWEALLRDYDLVHGGLMPVGLLVIGASPIIVRRLRRRSANPAPAEPRRTS